MSNFIDFSLNEPLVTAMLARLNTNLNAAIAQNNAERTNPAYPLNNPAQILPAPPTAGQLNAGFPIIAVADGDITFVDDVGWGTTEHMDITLLAYDYDLDPVALAWRLRRWAQVLCGIGMFGRHVDQGAWGTKLRRIVPSPRVSKLDPSTGKPIVTAFVAVIITAMDEQDTP